LQRFGLPTCAVQGQHELAPQSLPQGVLCHESFELGHDLRVTTELELGLDQLLVGGGAELLEASDLDARERFEGEIGQGRPAPETKRLAQELCAPLGIAALRRLCD